MPLVSVPLHARGEVERAMSPHLTTSAHCVRELQQVMDPIQLFCQVSVFLSGVGLTLQGHRADLMSNSM